MLSTLPPEISSLSSLMWIGLRNNKLTSLPLEIGQLSSLKHIVLDGNPILMCKGE